MGNRLIPPLLRSPLVVLAALGALVFASGAQAEIDFAPRVNIQSATKGTYWLASGDLNGDAIVDLIVAAADDTVVIHRGQGAGNFSGGTAIPVGSEPFGVTVADFNGDAKLDIATANHGVRSVSILLGDGAGGIVSSSMVGVGAGPTSITAGDVNADGKVDLIVMNVDSRNASLLLGNGDGTFVASFIGVGPFGFDSAVGDVTGDGVADLVIAGDGVRVLPGPLPASVPFQFATGVPVFRVGVGDFNRDGRLDVAAARAASNDVSVALGLGGTAFSTGIVSPVSNFPSAIAVADFNADGVPDIATTNAFSNDVSVLEGFGNGAFAKARQFRVGLGPQGIQASDLNGDGRVDLLVANGAGTVSVLMSRPLPPGAAGSAKRREGCARPRRIVAATSIACVTLGMSRAQAVELLGKPRSIRRQSSASGYVYVYRGLFVSFSRFNGVDLIWTTRPRVGLANGVAVGSPGALVRRRFPKATCQTRRGVQFCDVSKVGGLFTGFVITRGNVVEIDVGVGSS